MRTDCGLLYFFFGGGGGGRRKESLHVGSTDDKEAEVDLFYACIGGEDAFDGLFEDDVVCLIDAF